MSDALSGAGRAVLRPAEPGPPAVLTSDVALAELLAEGAGRRLLDVRRSLTGASQDELKRAGDREAQVYLAAGLQHARPDDAVLSEEAADDPARLAARRVWIIDPLDGTREYSEGRDDWAVHVALCLDGVASVGAVALPARGLTLTTDDAPVDRAERRGGPRLAVSRTRPTEHARRLIEALGGELVPMGSAGVKAMSVVLGETDVYAHSGGQYEWDSAAPVAVALAAGLHVSRLDGSPLVYNNANPYLPDLLICRPELAATVIGVCASVPAQEDR